jgi:hypothetical protein
MIVVVEEEEDVWVWVSEVQERGRVGRKDGVKKGSGVFILARRFFSVLV